VNGRPRDRALMTALLSACVAFQLNTSMMSAVLAHHGRELHTDEVGGLSQTAFSPRPIFGCSFPGSPISGPAPGAGRVDGLLVLGSCWVRWANIVVLDIARSSQGCSGPVVPSPADAARDGDEPRRYAR